MNLLKGEFYLVEDGNSLHLEENLSQTLCTLYLNKDCLRVVTITCIFLPFCNRLCVSRELNIHVLLVRGTCFYFLDPRLTVSNFLKFYSPKLMKPGAAN